MATGSKNIGESLSRFGVGDDDRDLLAVVVVKGGCEEAALRAERALAQRVEGRVAPLEELEQVYWSRNSNTPFPPPKKRQC